MNKNIEIKRYIKLSGFILILNIIKFCFLECYVILPFNTINKFPVKINQGDFSQDDFLSLLNKEKIFTSISLGEKPKELELYFSSNEYNFYIGQGLCEKNSNSSYDPQFSKSVKKSKENIVFSGKITNVSILIEKLSLFNSLNLKKNTTLKNAQFLYGQANFSEKNSKLNQICGYIGLQICDKDILYLNDYFINILKNYNIINSYSWSFIFFNNHNSSRNNIDKKIKEKYDGFFIAGITEDDVIDIFETDDIRTINAKSRGKNIYWDITFIKITFNTTEYGGTSTFFVHNVQAELNVDLNFIECNERYFLNIYYGFFRPYLTNNTCSINTTKEIKGKSIINCNKDLFTQKDISKFPTIHLENEEIHLVFNLTYEDLFVEYCNKIIFLVIYEESNKNWILGKPFLKKYPFIFDYDKKTISFININTEKKVKKKIIEKDNFDKNGIIFNFKNMSIYVLLFFGIIIGLIIGKKIWNKNRKKRANELEDEFSYNSYKNKKTNRNDNHKTLYEGI